MLSRFLVLVNLFNKMVFVGHADYLVFLRLHAIDSKLFLGMP